MKEVSEMVSIHDVLQGKVVKPVKNQKFEIGDYVLATKYSDADPHDRWRVDLVHAVESGCLLFKDTGVYGYRFAVKITQQEGEMILSTYQELYP